MAADVRRQWREVVRKWMLYPAGPAVEDGSSWAPELECADRDKYKEVQSEKLEVSFRYLYECSPFYRDKFKRAGLTPSDIRSVDDLRKIPVTLKKEYVRNQQEHPPWGNFSPVDAETRRERGWMAFASSGTTMAPRPFWHTRHDKEVWPYINARGLWAMGVRPEDVFIICFGYGPHVGFWGIHYGAQLLGCTIIPTGGMDTKRRVSFIDWFRPTVWGGTPSYALYMGETMKEMGLDPAASAVARVVTGGEPGICVPATKRRLDALWNAKSFDFFGCTEVGMAMLGYTCEPQAAYAEQPISPHIPEDMYIVEIVDPQTFEPLPEGERGITLVTNLYSEATCIPRYEMGDYSAISTAPCECGRTLARAVGGLVGRADDMLLIRGLVVFPSGVEDVVRSFKELGDEFQLIVERVKELDEISVQAEPLSSVPQSDWPALQRRLADSLRNHIGVRFSVQLVPRGTLPKTEFKAKRLKDLRRQPAGGS